MKFNLRLCMLLFFNFFLISSFFLFYKRYYHLFTVEGIRGDRAKAPHRERKDNSALQNENICPRRYSSQISFLVFLASVKKV